MNKLSGTLTIDRNWKIAVVIPCYRVRNHILDVLKDIPDFVWRIICVDDCCPDGTGALIEKQCHDARVNILTLDENVGVGGAMAAGYRAALAGGADIVAKIDGDGQMDPAKLGIFVEPIIAGKADYTKGNRFFYPSALSGMPMHRLMGNSTLSFLSKLSTILAGLRRQ